MPGWLRNYRRELLPGDIGAGIIVALLMVPQGMAYAIVAGLSPITGLYASILPPLAYALFGTSMTQSVGPQAITALLVAGVLAPLALPASPEYVLLAARLALLTGLILLACGLLRLGFLVNYLSQPVMSGFTNGAVLLIAAGQVPSLLGPADLGIPLVGEVPTGLPPIGIHLAGGPWRELFVPALLLGFISRSAVSHEAGANTPLASLVAAHIVTLVAVVSMGAERGNGSRGAGVAATPRAAAHCFTAVGGESLPGCVL